MPDVLSPYRTRFSQRSARSGVLYAGITALVLVDSVWVHAMLMSRHPTLVWFVDGMNALAIAIVWLEYRALGQSAITVDRDQLWLHVGWKFNFALPLDRVSRAFTPTFRDLPQWGSTASQDFLDLTRPARANVLLELTEPATVRLLGPITKSVRRIALHVDDAPAFLAALERVER